MENGQPDRIIRKWCFGRIIEKIDKNSESWRKRQPEETGGDNTPSVDRELNMKGKEVSG